MCTELYVQGGNHWIEQARELAALVGRENVLWWGDADDEPPVPEPSHHAGSDLAFCLCPVAVEETMQRAGYVVEGGWDEFSCDYLARLPTPSIDPGLSGKEK